MSFRHTPTPCCAHHGPVVQRDPHGHACGTEPHAHPAPHTHSVTGVEVHRPRQRRALLLSLVLTLATMVLEAVAGFLTGSLMLLSDSVHMLSHGVSLAVSWTAIWIASRPRSARSHFGLFRAEILASLFNAIGLFVLTGWILWEAVGRLREPVAIEGAEMLAVAVVGLVVNLATAWLLGRSGAEDLNTRSALLHMLGDLVSSVVIVAGGLVYLRTGWVWLDPTLSVFVALVILWWGVGLLRSSCSILLERSPEGLAPEKVESLLRSEPGVKDVHDLHIWEITSGYVCLTAHLVVDADTPVSATAEIRESACARLWDRFRVAHVTLQLESNPAPAGG